MVRVTGFACISFPLAGDAEKKSRYSPAFALVHAHVTDMCGHDSNPVTDQEEGAPTGLPLPGPSDRVRTCGLMVPNHPRYQLRYTRIYVLFRAPHRERLDIIVHFSPACKSFLVPFLTFGNTDCHTGVIGHRFAMTPLDGSAIFFFLPFPRSNLLDVWQILWYCVMWSVITT